MKCVALLVAKRRFCDESGSGILCIFKFLNEEGGDVLEEGVAIIEARCYVGMDWDFGRALIKIFPNF